TPSQRSIQVVLDVVQAVQHCHAFAHRYRVSPHIGRAIALGIVARDVKVDFSYRFAAFRHSYPLAPAMAMACVAMAAHVPRPNSPSPTTRKTNVMAFSAAGLSVNSNRMVRSP